MPKELIHFTVAERTAQRLADTRFAPCIESQPDGLLLGSVFHDALFYAVTPGGRPLESLSHQLHGADGQDTFMLIRLQAEHVAQTGQNALPVAVLVGMISHLYADVVMHPLIWYLTGNYYADDTTSKSMARQRHRALESLMDMVACPDKLGHARYKLRRMLKQCDTLLSQGLPVAAIGYLADMNHEHTEAQLTIAWSCFSILQAVYPSRMLAGSLSTLRPYLPRFLAEIATLFYAPQLMKQAEFLRSDILYRHPVTGEELSATLDGLIDAAARQAEELCRRLEPAIFDGQQISLPGVGPSMDAGLSGVPTEKMLHFATPLFPDLT